MLGEVVEVGLSCIAGMVCLLVIMVIVFLIVLFLKMTWRLIMKPLGATLARVGPFHLTDEDDQANPPLDEENIPSISGPDPEENVPPASAPEPTTIAAISAARSARRSLAGNSRARRPHSTSQNRLLN
jgi:hypothetical protein